MPKVRHCLLNTIWYPSRVLLSSIPIRHPNRILPSRSHIAPSQRTSNPNPTNAPPTILSRFTPQHDAIPKRSSDFHCDKYRISHSLRHTSTRLRVLTRSSDLSSVHARLAHLSTPHIPPPTFFSQPHKTSSASRLHNSLSPFLNTTVSNSLPAIYRSFHLDHIHLFRRLWAQLYPTQQTSGEQY